MPTGTAYALSRAKADKMLEPQLEALFSESSLPLRGPLRRTVMSALMIRDVPVAEAFHSKRTQAVL
jgi:hypothetical protein